jgi:aspartokinase/homoserine dehydrogenase 1
MSSRPPRPAIHKFGGASLADATAIRGAVAIIARQPAPRVIVVSALAGVTDLLLEVITLATAGAAEAANAAVAQFRTRHTVVASELLRGAPLRESVGSIDAAADELMALASSLAVLREASARVRDHIVGRGERLSAALVTAALTSAGHEAALIDPAEVVITAGPYGGAVPDLEATRRAARRTLAPLLAAGALPVVPGFLGRAPDEGTATLGRGGSDLTATLLARALDAPAVTLWKDVPGLLTADPRVVPDARLLTHIHLEEAAELAYYGAKVLHPRALLPLVGRRAPLFVRAFADPDAPGTEISARRDTDRSPVRALSAIHDQALVTISGSGILGVPGMAARTFGALQDAGISVSLIAQASSEYTIDFTMPASVASEAVQVLRRAFRAEIRTGEINGVEVRTRVAIIAVVGLRMAGHPGIAARVFDALAEGQVNVIAIAQGSSERNISVAVDERAVPEALRRIHTTFQLGKVGGGRPSRPAGRDVVLLGAGTIGRAVLQLLAEHPKHFGRLRIVAVVDRRGAIIDADGLPDARLREIADAKRAGQSLGDLPAARRGSPRDVLHDLTHRALVRPILADVTADETLPLLRTAADAGFDLVLANKKPLAAAMNDVDALRATLAARGGALRFEATVGAGLPTIAALEQLTGTGDRIRRLQGCLSGTLGVVLSALDEGIPFSVAVHDALARGFTEPDPRDDLSGLDVARKALILARMLGHRREFESVVAESLVGRGASLPTDKWLAGLARGDAVWAERVAAARGAGQVLRYVATVTPSSVEVGLREVPRDSPLGQLRGAANQLVITSDRYHDSPMVITGPGAGPEVTATGVLADLRALAG